MSQESGKPLQRAMEAGERRGRSRMTKDKKEGVTIQTISSPEMTLQKRMHASTRVCRGIGCDAKFSPRKRHQVFCCVSCREYFFRVARHLGVTLLRKSESGEEWKKMVSDLLNERS